MKMRFNGLALLASAAVLGACGGGDKSAAGTKTDTAAAPAPTTTANAPAAGAVAAKPATGKTVEIKMIGDGTSYKFDPANPTVKEGDNLKFTVVGSVGPHNVTFNADSIPAAGKAQLSANMPQQMSDLSGPLLQTAGDSYEVSTAGVAPGKYSFYCTPHLAMGMKGVLTITP
jgi:plastocyanin